MVKKYKNIPVSEETGFRFDKLQLDLKIKGVLRTQDELINLLINVFQDSNNPSGY